jgi:hypothetical protein
VTICSMVDGSRRRVTVCGRGGRPPVPVEEPPDSGPFEKLVGSRIAGDLS